MSEPNHTPSSANGGCGAVALIVIGAMILIPSGLCTAVFGVGAVIDLNAGRSQFLSDFYDVWPLALVVVAVAVGGIFMIRAGIRMQRRR